jgi:succinate dehydrogenase flavin-adding protein (antitoxin of CptAB toxin-antitoxin module)
MKTELKKAEEFSSNENNKTKYVKFLDDQDKEVYTLTLPNGEVVENVNQSVALYVHSLENRLKLK